MFSISTVLVAETWSHPSLHKYGLCSEGLAPCLAKYGLCSEGLAPCLAKYGTYVVKRLAPCLAKYGTM